MFLSSIEAKHRAMKEKFSEIRQVLSNTTMPSPSTAGVTNGLRISYSLRNRLIEAQSRHRLASMKETIFKAMMLGLITLERLPPESPRDKVVEPDDFYEQNGFRVLTEDEVGHIRDNGYKAPFGIEDYI